MDANRVYDLFERTASLLRAEERRVAAEFGLQPVHLHTLRYLARCNRYSDNPAAVTEYLGVTKGTASQTVLVLKDKGLVESHPDRGDRRKLHLRLTPSGRNVLSRAIPPRNFREAVEQLATGCPTFDGSLVEFLRTLQSLNNFRPFGLCMECRFLQQSSDRPSFRCGLTGESLKRGDTSLICREYEAEPNIIAQR